MKIILRFLSLIMFLAAAFATSARAQNPITIQWDDPVPGSPQVDVYRLYKVTKVDDVVTYTQLNDDAIAGAARQYTTTKTSPGMVLTLRAANSVGESDDSTWLTLPSKPEPPQGLRTMKLVVEASPDLINWGAHAVLAVAAVPPQQFFRLRW